MVRWLNRWWAELATLFGYPVVAYLFVAWLFPNGL